MRFILVAVLLAAVFACVSAYPTNAGTCVVNQMATNGHGVSNSTCNGCYSLAVKKWRAHGQATNYRVTLSGPGPIKGLLLYATNLQTKKRFGIFSSKGQTYVPLPNCGGADVDANTITHTNSDLKPLPVTLTWSDGGLKAATVIQGIVVKDYSNWYDIAPVNLY